MIHPGLVINSLRILVCRTHPLREWNAVNVDVEAQLKETWQHLHYTIVVIDYFLNRFVFLRHATQFQMKLQASGWEFPSYL